MLLFLGILIPRCSMLLMGMSIYSQNNNNYNNVVGFVFEIIVAQAMQRLLVNEAVCPRLAKFLGHFFGRVKGMLLDVDGAVCR